MKLSGKTSNRFDDGAREPCVMLTPIEGFDEKPLVSLEQAVQPLIQFIPDIQIKVARAKTRAANHPDDLTLDESAAITLYTMEGHPHTNSLYYILNDRLRAEDRERLVPWFSYLKLILTALARLPMMNLIIYRGILLIDPEKYQPGNDVIWWGFSSCSTDRNIAESKIFGEQDHDKTMFIINSIKGIDISKHSYFRQEQVLLLPATTLRVMQCIYQPNNCSIIHLQEIQSPHPLLRSTSTMPKNSPPRSSSVINESLYSNRKLEVKIARLKDRSHAYLSTTRLTDDDMKMIVQQVIREKQCPVLILRGHEATTHCATILAEAIGDNSILEELYLIDIQIGDAGSQALAKPLCNPRNSNLKRLCLNHNGITDDRVEHLAAMLRINRSLTHLWLPNNQITDRGIQLLAEALEDNCTLQILSLEWNVFAQDDTVNSLLELMEKNQSLTQMIIDGRALSRNQTRKLKDMARKKNDFRLKIQ